MRRAPPCRTPRLHISRAFARRDRLVKALAQSPRATAHVPFERVAAAVAAGAPPPQPVSWLQQAPWRADKQPPSKAQLAAGRALKPACGAVQQISPRLQLLSAQEHEPGAGQLLNVYMKEMGTGGR